MKRVYLDYNATAPMREEAKMALTDATNHFNASSIYHEGRQARALIEEARTHISAFAGGGDVIFTSGGTEACNLAFGLPAQRLIVGATEHAAVLKAAQKQNLPLSILPCDENGVVSLDALEEALQDSSPALVCVMIANNETGALQPIEEIATATRAHGSLLFCDAVQAAGKISLENIPLDALALSAHKLGGAQGIGALVIRRKHKLTPNQFGGAQELGLRAGTENILGIAAFAAVAQLTPATNLRDRFEAGLRALTPDIKIFSEDITRLANTSCFALAGQSAETLLMKYDLAGFSLSTGAACSSGKVEPSHVLEAMGVDSVLTKAALRVSFGWQSQPSDVDAFLSHWQKFTQNQQAA